MLVFCFMLWFLLQGQGHGQVGVPGLFSKSPLFRPAGTTQGGPVSVTPRVIPAGPPQGGRGVTVTPQVNVGNGDSEYAAWKAKYRQASRLSHRLSNFSESARYTFFKANRDMVNAHNRNRSKTFSMELNFMADLSDQEIRSQFLGFTPLQRPSRRTRSVLSKSFIAKTSFSGELDWRTRGAVTPVEDQNYCGSCWAFSAAGAMEGRLQVATGKLVSLSEQNLLDCVPSFGCQGGHYANAFEYAAQVRGIKLQSNYMYEKVQGQCRQNSMPGNNYAPLDSTTSYIDVAESENAIIEALQGGPLSIATTVVPSFEYYKQGVYSDGTCQSQAPNHAMTLVGYGTDASLTPPLPFWIVKNSWSANWGENGYVRIARDSSNTCGKLRYAMYPVIDRSQIGIKCGEPSAISNGKYSGGTSYEVGATRTIICNNGYKFTSSQNVITCRASGLWSSASGTCSPQSDPNLDRQLYVAAKNGSLSEVQSLLQRGANPNWQSLRDEPCEIGQPLFINGVMARVILPRNSTALHAAVGCVRPIDFSRNLIDFGANINAEAGAWTALTLGAKVGPLETVRLLIDRGADINRRDDYNQTALVMAVSYCNLEIARLLLDRGININQKDKRGLTAFSSLVSSISLIENRHHSRDICWETAKLLLDRGADVNSKVLFGTPYRTALSFAAEYDLSELAKLLSSRGASKEGCNAAVVGASNVHLCN